MARKPKRLFLVHLNKYQKELLWPVLGSCSAGCLIALLALDYFYFDRASLICNFSFSHLRMLFPWFLTLAVLLVGLVGVQVYLISSKILGPYNRIVRELDQFLTGKSPGHLNVRKGDEMFRDLTRRINQLIDRIP